MARSFIGRQNEILLNDEHFKLFKLIQHLNDKPENKEFGPQPDPNKKNDYIPNGALWLDESSELDNVDLDYYNNGVWDILFKARFQKTDHLLDIDEPINPVPGQLWIQNGLLYYYKNGEWVPIKAIEANLQSTDLRGFRDFIIINNLKIKGQNVLDDITNIVISKDKITTWEKNKEFKKDDIIIIGADIYICIKDHISSERYDLKNKDCWKQLFFLNQYLLPDVEADKVFKKRDFIHEKLNEKEKGFSKDSDVSISMPVQFTSHDNIHTVHVNPDRLDYIDKAIVKIDKKNPIIHIPEENTEFYAIKNGNGKFLIKGEDYTSVNSNNINCIKLKSGIFDNYNFIYALHYNFIDNRAQNKGLVNKKKFRLNQDDDVYENDTVIHIGEIDTPLCVFAQGLYYEQNENTYIYNKEEGNIIIKEPLKYNNFEIAIITTVKKIEGRLTYESEYEEIEIDIQENNIIHKEKVTAIKLKFDKPYKNNYIMFINGVACAEQNKINKDEKTFDIKDCFLLADPYGDDTIKYIIGIDQNIFHNHLFVDNLENKLDCIDWSLIETDIHPDDDTIYQSYRGRITTLKNNRNEIIIPITDSDTPIEYESSEITIKDDESPIIFVDGVYIFQQDIERRNGYLKIKGLEEGQEVIVIADKNPNHNITSDSILFEDFLSPSTIKIPVSDDVIVYMNDHILCDSSSLYVSSKPTMPGYDGEIKYCKAVESGTYYIYNADKKTWEQVNQEDTAEDLKGLISGYAFSYNKLNFLQKYADADCTYYAYRYADAVQHKLNVGFVYPNGKDGINVVPDDKINAKPFKTNYRDFYIPGRNELSIYFNGVRQNLLSPNDSNYTTSINKEYNLNRNHFVLAYDNDTKFGQAIPESEGYYVYKITDQDNKTKTIFDTNKLTEQQIENIKKDNKTVECISEPKINKIFYVIERCEYDEDKACERKILTYKDLKKGAYFNTYDTKEFSLNRGNIRVFINGIRQPYGSYKTLETIKTNPDKNLHAFRILDAHTLKIEDPLIGGQNNNESITEPKFLLTELTLPDGTKVKKYHDVINEILIESRSDYRLKEMTIPIKDSLGVFTIDDGLPIDLFKSKDHIMIYINGLAYGDNYVVENKRIILRDDNTCSVLGKNKTDLITFEWR